MSYVTLALGALLLAAVRQDSAEDEKAVRAKIAECKRQLGSKDQGEVISAIQLLAGFKLEEARVAIAGSLRSPKEAVRQAAAGALAKQRCPTSAKAVGAVLPIFVADRATTKLLIDSLAELDMCTSVNYLLLILEADKHAYTADVLNAIGKIGCPLEAAPALVAFLKKAEEQEAQPDNIYMPGGKGGGGGGNMANTSKDKVLAKLAGTTRATLSRISGKSYKTYKEWEAWLRGEVGAIKLGKVLLCESSGDTFEIAAGAQVKCPTQDPKKGHKDIFLKHRREGDLIGGDTK